MFARMALEKVQLLAMVSTTLALLSSSVDVREKPEIYGSRQMFQLPVRRTFGSIELQGTAPTEPGAPTA